MKNNNDHYPAGYGVSDREGYTAEDYAKGTSIWHIHQDKMQHLEEERAAKPFAPDLFEVDESFDYDAPLFPAADEASALSAEADTSAPIVRTPKLGANSFAMSPHILCSSMFTITTRLGKDAKRPYREETLLTTNGRTIDYRGLELWQEDQSVLFGLLKLAQGKSEEDLQAALADPELAIEFAPTSFCTIIGWSDNSENVDRLEKSILRLRGAFLVLRRSRDGNEDGCTMGFVKDFRWKGVKRWKVWLDPRIVGLFSNHISFVSAAKRKLLSEGMQTWLYGVICANNCKVPFKYETLHAASGSKAKDMKEFGRSVRAALTRMQELGIIPGFEQERGAVRIFKALSK